MRTYNLAMEEQGELDRWNEGEWVRAAEVKDKIADMQGIINDQQALIEDLESEVDDLKNQLREAQDYE